jgi:hypothetical protein
MYEAHVLPLGAVPDTGTYCTVPLVIVPLTTEIEPAKDSFAAKPLKASNATTAKERQKTRRVIVVSPALFA